MWPGDVFQTRFSLCPKSPTGRQFPLHAPFSFPFTSPLTDPNQNELCHIPGPGHQHCQQCTSEQAMVKGKKGILLGAVLCVALLNEEVSCPNKEALAAMNQGHGCEVPDHTVHMPILMDQNCLPPNGYWGYIGIMEKKMETTIVGYVGYILR